VHQQRYRSGMSTVRDDTATTACPVYASPFQPEGRQRFCSTPCRQTAWRRRRAAPVEPTVAKADTVYVCPSCHARYLGDQRCDECNSWCCRLGPGGPCPCCDEPIGTDLDRSTEVTPSAGISPTKPLARTGNNCSKEILDSALTSVRNSEPWLATR